MKFTFDGTMDELNALIGGGQLLAKIAQDVNTLAQQESSFAGSLFDIANKVNAGAQELESLMATLDTIGN